MHINLVISRPLTQSFPSQHRSTLNVILVQVKRMGKHSLKAELRSIEDDFIPGFPHCPQQEAKIWRLRNLTSQNQRPKQVIKHPILQISIGEMIPELLLHHLVPQRRNLGTVPKQVEHRLISGMT